MKNISPVLFSLLLAPLFTAVFGATSAFAAGYECEFKVYENNCDHLGEDCENPLIGEMKFSQEFGALAGRIYTVRLSEKHNLLGKLVKESELALDGMIQYAGESDKLTAIDLHLYLDSTEYKKTIERKRLELAHLKGEGTKQDVLLSDKYITNGGCTVTP
jgi:hypothetical protein